MNEDPKFEVVQLVADGPCRFMVPDNPLRMNGVTDPITLTPMITLGQAVDAVTKRPGPCRSWFSVSDDWLGAANYNFMAFPNWKRAAVVRDACGMWWLVFDISAGALYP